MEKEYEKITEDYIRISSETRNKLTALSVTLVAAIYFFSTPSNTTILKVALLFYILTIFGEIISGFLKSQHYSQWFEHKIKTIDFRESIWGKMAEKSFWFPPCTFLIGSILFFIGIFL